MPEPFTAPETPVSAQAAGPAGGSAAVPAYRPRDQFWPYADLEEEPSDEELARLDPALQDALLERPSDRPFSFTLVFAPFDGPGYARSVELARASGEYLEVGVGSGLRHRARFTPEQVLDLRDLWQLIGGFDTSEVLIDGRPLPFARELWLPLLWYLLPR